MPDIEDEVITKNKLFELLTDTQKTVNQMQQTLNNGLKTGVERNSKNIHSLKSEVRTLCKNINMDVYEEKGVKKYKQRLGWYISGILSVVTVLSLLGVIG